MSDNCAFVNVGFRWFTYFLFKRTYIRSQSRVVTYRQPGSVFINVVYAVIIVDYVFIIYILH